MYSGTIKHLRPEGYGFIISNGGEEKSRDVFFHANELQGVQFNELTIGQDVEFEEIVKTSKGYQVKKIRVV